MIIRCNVCVLVYQWTNSCPDSYEYQQNVKHDQDVQIALHKISVKTLMGESLSMTVPNTGCTKTVCSLSWLNYCLETL